MSGWAKGDELRADVLLKAATDRALKIAGTEAAKIDEEELEKPTTLRLSKRTAAFYDAIAYELRISRNSAMELVLDQVMRSSLPK